MDEQTPVVRQFYQVFQDGPQGSSGQPITAPTNISVQSTSAVVTGLQLQVRSTHLRPANARRIGDALQHAPKGNSQSHCSTCESSLQGHAATSPALRARSAARKLSLTVSSHAQYGESYYVVVSAVNAAGLVGTAKSQDVSIERQSENLPPAKVAGIVLAAVLGTGAAVAALTIWITRRRCMPCL